MASKAQPATSRPAAPSVWRRVVLVAVVALLLVASVAAQALDLTPFAIALFVAALVALAPLVNPATGS
jgi:hypothetical protein